MALAWASTGKWSNLLQKGCCWNETQTLTVMWCDDKATKKLQWIVTSGRNSCRINVKLAPKCHNGTELHLEEQKPSYLGWYMQMAMTAGLLMKTSPGRRLLVWISLYIQPSWICAWLKYERCCTDAHQRMSHQIVGSGPSLVTHISHLALHTEDYTHTRPHWLANTQFLSLIEVNAFCLRVSALDV